MLGTFGSNRFLCFRYVVEDLDAVQVEVSPVAVKSNTQDVEVTYGSKKSKRLTMPLTLFGIFDGHGGDKASQFCADWLSAYIRHDESYPYDLGYAMKNAFTAIDEDFVGTGQTGLMQGAKYGVAMDAVPPQFCCGELEGAIVAASEAERPDVILIEGQGALSHPAFCTSAFILRGSQPDAVILQHAQKRAHRCDFPTMSMPTSVSEIALIEAFCDTKVIGVTLNHEGMSDAEITDAIAEETETLGLPVTDALSRPEAELWAMVVAAYPRLQHGMPMASV